MRGWLWLGVAAQLLIVVSCTNTGSVRRTTRRIEQRKPPVVRAIRQRDADASPFAHAILLNGGQSPQANFYSHMVHLREMRKVLLARRMSDKRITIFASDGNHTDHDLVVVDSLSAELKFLFQYRFERAFFEPIPRLINSVIPGKRLLPSRRWELSKFVSTLAERLPDPGTSPNALPRHADERPVLLFVTDHGTRNKRWPNARNQQISLWNESLNVEQFAQLLRPMRQRRVVYVMSQCFSGSFAWSVYPQPGVFATPEGHRCGFFSTTARRYAYGCYAQTQRGEDIGHAHRFIHAMKGAATLDEAHRRVLLTDKTPDVPIRSSDAYLRALLVKEARRGQRKPADLANQLLARYSQLDGQLIAQEQQLIDAMAARFLVSRPRDLKDVARLIGQYRKQMAFRKGLNRSWRAAYASLRNDYLKQFYAQSPGMFERIRSKWKQLMRDLKRQQGYGKDPDVLQLRTGFAAFLAKHPKAHKRLRLLAERHATSRKLRFWNEVQMAVAMRMEVLLYRMAGRLFLVHNKRGFGRRHRRSLGLLLACEGASLGPVPQGQTTNKPLPPLARDTKAAIPSILGIQFRQFIHRIDPRVTKGTVQVKAVGLQTPAERAGIQRGDLLVGANGRAFHASYELREQVMLHPQKQPFLLQVLRGKQLLKIPVKLEVMKTPDFLKLRDIQGSALPKLAEVSSLTPGATLPDANKEVVMLFYWATWCGPCKMALPVLRKWHTRYPRLKIIAISPEKRAVVEKWYAGHPDAMPFLRAHDKFGQMAVKLLVFSFPTFILARKGKIALVHKGAHKFAMLEKQIQAALR